MFALPLAMGLLPFRAARLLPVLLQKPQTEQSCTFHVGLSGFFKGFLNLKLLFFLFIYSIYSFTALKQKQFGL